MLWTRASKAHPADIVTAWRNPCGTHGHCHSCCLSACNAVLAECHTLQTTFGRTFAGDAFIADPVEVVFKDFVPGTTYKAAVQLINRSFCKNSIRLLEVPAEVSLKEPSRSGWVLPSKAKVFCQVHRDHGWLVLQAIRGVRIRLTSVQYHISFMQSRRGGLGVSGDCLM